MPRHSSSSRTQGRSSSRAHGGSSSHAHSGSSSRAHGGSSPRSLDGSSSDSYLESSSRTRHRADEGSTTAILDEVLWITALRTIAICQLSGALTGYPLLQSLSLKLAAK